MVAQPNVPGRRLASGHETSAASSRPVPAAEPAVEPAVQPSVEPAGEPETVADVVEEAAPAEGESVPVPEVPVAPAPSGGLPRWLLLLLGGATATIAVAGLREIS